MPFLHEFGLDDIFINRLETAPQYEFTAYSGSLYVNNARFAGKNTPTGSISVYELNVDRTAISGTAENLPATGTITCVAATAANLNTGSILLQDAGGRKVFFQYDSGLNESTPIRWLAKTHPDILSGSDWMTSSIASDYNPVAIYKIGCAGGFAGSAVAHAAAIQKAIRLANGTDAYVSGTGNSGKPSTQRCPFLDVGQKINDIAIDVDRAGAVLTLTQRLGQYTKALNNDQGLTDPGPYNNSGIGGNTPILIANSGSVVESKATEVGFGGGSAQGSVHAFVVKDGNNMSFKSIAPSSYNQNEYGTKLTGAYPLTSSISRQYIYGGRTPPYQDGKEGRKRGALESDSISWNPRTPSAAQGLQPAETADPGYQSTDIYFSQSRPLIALRNSIEKYRKYSPAFRFQTPSASAGVTAYALFGTGKLVTDDDPTVPPYMTGAINLISIPAIFYGSSIEKGSVDLKFYYTGTLMDQAKDERRNGELISVTPGSEVSGSTVGVVMYDEGFILLYNEKNINGNAVVTDSYSGTGSIDDDPHTCDGTGVQFRPNWTYFMSHDTGSSGSQGLKAGSDPTPDDPRGYPPTVDRIVHVAGFDHAPGGATRTDRCHAFYPSASHFSLSFRGKNIVPTMTMFANAPPGELNNSQNPTWLSSSYSGWRKQIHFDSSSYMEPKFMSIKNTVQSDYCNYEDTFEKQTFISKVGIYDENKNLLGIAKLATPVLKRETDSYTFKLKLDM